MIYWTTFEKYELSTKVLEAGGLRAMLASAIAAATRRSSELARDYGTV